MKYLLIIISLLIFSFTTYAEDAKSSGYYGIIDLKIMDEKEYDSSRDKTIIGYILPHEVFKSRAECEGELINAYAGTTWEIEKTKNPHRDGELKLHQYRPRVNIDTNRLENQTDLVRFCIRLIEPLK